MRGVIKWMFRIVLVLTVIIGVGIIWFWNDIQRVLRVNTLFAEENIVTNFSSMPELFFATQMSRGDGPVSLLPEGTVALPNTWTADGPSLQGQEVDLEEFYTARSVTAMVVLQGGTVVSETYRMGTGPEDRRISWSVAKSFLSALLGTVIADGDITSLDDPVDQYAPELVGSAYEGVTLRNVLHMASGVEFNEDYLDFNSDINRMGRVLALGGSMDGFAAGLSDRIREQGTERQYVSIDTHVIGMVIRGATGRSVIELMEERIIQPLGLEADPIYLTDGNGVAFVLGGLNLRTRDYARFGQMILQNGRWDGQQIVPVDWIAQSTTNSAPQPTAEVLAMPKGSLGYGYQWWTPPDAQVGEFFAIGVYGQYIYINQARDVVIAMNSADRDFTEGDGAITLSNIEMFRAIAGRLDFD